MNDIDQRLAAVFDQKARGVRLMAVAVRNVERGPMLQVAALAAGVGLLLIAALLPALSQRAAERVGTPAPTASPVLTLASRVSAVVDQLAFVPLVPSTAPSGVATVPSVEVRTGPGAPTLLEIKWPPKRTGHPAMLILQGPAGCCLDSVRPYARRDIEVRPGVLAELIPLRSQDGGSILWWLEGDAYIAVSGPDLTEEDLVEVARGMRPIR